MSCEAARKVITNIYQDTEIDDCISKLVTKGLRDDFKQELFLILLKLPCETIDELKGDLKYYVVKIVLNLVRQKRNVFHKKYLDNRIEYNTDKLILQSDNQPDFSERVNKENFEDSLLEKIFGIDIELGNHSYPYYEAMIRLLAECGSLRNVTKKTGIPKSTVHRTVNKIRNHLK